MAVTSTSYFANAIVGQPQVGADYNIYDSHVSPRYSVGTGFTRSDGNKFRYCHFGLAAAVGMTVATDRSESNLSGSNQVINPTSAGKPDFEPINMGAVGSRYVEATLSLSNNQMAGGYLTVFGNTGSGYTYRIRGNTTPDSTRSGAARIQLWDKIKVALDQTSDISLIGSPYANLEPAVTGSTGAIAADNGARGVAVVAQTKDYYGWICTHGVTSVNIGENTTAGVGLIQGGVAGSLVMEASTLTGDNTVAAFVVGRALETVAVAQSAAPAYVSFE